MNYIDRLRDLIDGILSQASDRCLAVLTSALSESPAPEATLVGLEQFVRVVERPVELFERLANSPRSVEVLLKLFAGSPYLTGILLQEPLLLDQLTNPHSVGDLRSRQEFVELALVAAGKEVSADLQVAALRRFQQGELLRIGVCDFLGLLDLRSVTNQLSLLADALVQCALRFLRNVPNSDANDINDITAELAGFAVLALGKLGGEELNYSSDIDLIFVGDDDSARFTTLAQQLSKLLSDVSSNGLLYRVDLRLRPWGDAGPLVMPVASYLNYLQAHAGMWEKQALLKARVIAGDFSLGQQFLRESQPLIFSAAADDMRRSVWQAKQRIEMELKRRGRSGGDVKLGAGTIRDVEFVVQCLQLQHGGSVPEVRSVSTLDGLVRLADFGFVRADEFRELSSAYVLFRVIEHALQLKHCRQTHTLPSDSVELETLARRLDFPGASQLTTHFQQHRLAVRRIFEKYVGEGDAKVVKHRAVTANAGSSNTEANSQTSRSVGIWELHKSLLARLSTDDPLIAEWKPLTADTERVTIAGFDQLGDLSLMCGLLFVYGFDIVEGQVATEELSDEATSRRKSPLRFLNSFVVRRRLLPGTLPAAVESWSAQPPDDVKRLRQELHDLLVEVQGGRRREAQARVARRVSEALPTARPGGVVQLPVEIEFDNESDSRATVIHISAQDTSGFLYELTNALALLNVDVRQMEIQTVGLRVRDTLRATDESGRKLLDPRRQHELRVAIVLIQHFTDWLPQSPDPEAALLHFQQLLESELREPDWLERLASLKRPEVLATLTKVLGVGDLFWEDFLRLQHTHLFPVLTDIEGLRQAKSRADLQRELDAKLSSAQTVSARRDRLNVYKDREMFRIDMRHLAGATSDFQNFARELSELAEVVIAAACELVESELRSKYGEPQFAGQESRPCRWCATALGKLGGAEIGFASDIELLFLYEMDGTTSGPEMISNGKYFQHFVELFQKAIQAKRAGIFRIDLRLRPHGRAGNLASSLEEFARYFAADGDAWPFERQSLVRLRPIAGDEPFGREVLARRDDLIFVKELWDAVPVRAMRERQVRQLVRAGTFHAKLSPGALVDIEYLIQLLQLSNGDRHPSLRFANTLAALSELARLEVVPAEAEAQLRNAYLFFRTLIDALRMACGSADDLTVPKSKSDAFASLARRLNSDRQSLAVDVEKHSAAVRHWAPALGWPIVPT